MRSSDQPVGIDLAVLVGCCAVAGHCVGVMAMANRAPAWIRGSAAHTTLAGLLLAASIAALVGGLREHRQRRVLGWAAGGSLLLVLARLLPEGAGEGTEVAITLVACVLTGIFARLNASLRFWGDGTGS
jgi:hypothetical protein